MFKRVESSIPKLVSVIIPTYNRSGLVVKAIDSVLAQTYSYFEIIVVDDCSTDDTIAVLSKYGDRIRLVKNEVNSYVGFARNFGVSLARGEYVAFLDSDDSWLPNKLELQLTWMIDNDFEISTTGFYGYQHDTGILLEKNRPYSPKMQFKDILYGVFNAPGSTLVMKRDLFIAIKGYDITYRRIEDWDLLIKIFLKYHHIGFLNKPLAIIFASNNYTIDNLKKSSKQLFHSCYKSLWKVKWYYPVILLVGILFELFVTDLRSKKYVRATGYFITLNLLSLFQHPYFRIHAFTIKRLFLKRKTMAVKTAK